MVLDRKYSQEYPVNPAVPQGSILAPTLFLQYNEFFLLGFIHARLKGMELQEKEAQKDYSIQEICLVWWLRAAIVKKQTNKQTKKNSTCFIKILYIKKLLMN